MEVKDILSIIVPSIISIVGFTVTYLMNRREYDQSIQKIRYERQLNKLYGIQKEIFDFIDLYIRISMCAEGDQVIKETNALNNSIKERVLCFGSEDAVKLTIYINQLWYSAIDDGFDMPVSKMISPYLLLAMQIKFDTTGVRTSPFAWFVGKYTSQTMVAQGDLLKDSVEEINHIVDRLHLSSFLRVG